MIKGRITLILVAFVVAWESQASAEQWIVCLRKNGGFYRIGPEFTRQTCGRRETQTTLNTEGPQGMPGTELHLFDGNDHDLGIIIGTEAAPQVTPTFSTFILGLGAIAHFRQSRDPAATIIQPLTTIYFPAQDCVGTPYVSSAYPAFEVVCEGGFRCFITSTDPSVSLQPQSRLERGVCENLLPDTGPLYRVSETTLPFTLPLAWPLRVGIAP